MLPNYSESNAPQRVGGGERKPVQTISVLGAKGGDGKSSIAVNLAVALAKQHHKVILLDGNLSMGDVRSMLDLRPAHDVSHIFDGHRGLQDVMLNGPAGIKIVPGSTANHELAQLSQIQHIGLINSFSELDEDADILIVDNDSGLSQSVLSFAQASRENLIVVCDEPASLNHALATIKVLNEQFRSDHFRLVVNKVDSSQHGLDIFKRLSKRVNSQMDIVLDYCGSVPFDPQMKKSISERRAVVDAYPRSKSALSFTKMASRVECWPRPLEPEGHLEFFVERLVTNHAQYPVREHE